MGAFGQENNYKTNKKRQGKEQSAAVLTVGGKSQKIDGTRLQKRLGWKSMELFLRKVSG